MDLDLRFLCRNEFLKVKKEAFFPLFLLFYSLSFISTLFLSFTLLLLLCPWMSLTSRRSRSSSHTSHPAHVISFSTPPSLHPSVSYFVPFCSPFPSIRLSTLTSLYIYSLLVRVSPLGFLISAYFSLTSPLSSPSRAPVLSIFSFSTSTSFKPLFLFFWVRFLLPTLLSLLLFSLTSSLTFSSVSSPPLFFSHSLSSTLSSYPHAPITASPFICSSSGEL